MKLDAKIPAGPIAEKWDRHKFEMKLVNPANKRKYTIIVVGTGLAGASAAASLGELGYNVLNFCIQDSPRRAHSIAAQGGINAAKNYQNDGDSVYRLFYDTVKGGDFRSREANVYRLAQLSVNIIDQCVAQGVPFAREYGGLLANRSFGGAQVSRTFYARGQTGQQLLLGAYQSLMRQVHAKTVKLFPRREMLDLVVVDGKARGIIVRNLVTGEIERYAADAVILATGGYGTAYYLSTNAVNSNVTAAWRAHKRGALLRESLLHADSSDVHSGQRRPSVEADADEREPAQRRPRLGAEEEGRHASARADSRGRARLLPRAQVPGVRQPRAARRRLAQRQAGVRRRPRRRRERPGRLPRLRRRDHSGSASRRSRRSTATCSRCTRRSPTRIPYKVPMRIYPAIHYTMGGLWVDYNLMSNVPGLHVLGEANFSDHGANRLGASALMQGLADGYFVIPYTHRRLPGEQSAAEGHDRSRRVQGSRRRRAETDQQTARRQGQRETSDDIHRELGAIMWDDVGMARTEASLQRALTKIPKLREEFWHNVSVPGTAGQPQPEPRIRRPRRRLPRVRRTAGARRARAQGIVRRPFPRGEPDAGGRGAARRRALLVRRGVGIQGRRRAARAPQGTARVRRSPSVAAELQVEISGSRLQPPADYEDS